MPSLRHLALALLAVPLALALAACGDDKEVGPPQGEPIAAIPAQNGNPWTQVASETPEGGFVIGNPDAPLKLVEYASHTCPHCADFSATGNAGIEAYVEKGIVSYELRNQIHDPLDLTIAMLARCGPPSSFHPLANAVWQNFQQVMTTVQANGEQLNAAQQQPPAQRFQAIAQASGVLDFFAARGVSHDQAMVCLADLAKAQQIADNSAKQSDELNVTGTPTFFLNGTLLEGTTWEPSRGPTGELPGIEAQLQRAGAR
jgi:protein-disulfide isomerase